MLRDAALSWIRSHLFHPRFEEDFERRLEEASRLGRNLYLAMDRGLTLDAKPYLMHCFAGELFVFELTAGQAAGLGLRPGQVKWGTGLQYGRVPPCPAPQVALADPHVDDADHHPQDRPVVAGAAYDAGGNPPGPCVLRLDYDLPGSGSVVGWHYPDRPMEGRGRIHGRFPPMTLASPGRTVEGLVVVFLRLFTLPDPQSTAGRRPIGNTCAALVSVA